MASQSFTSRKKRKATVIAVVVALVAFSSTFASLRLINQVWAPTQDDNSAPPSSLHGLPHKQHPQNSTLAQHNQVINVPLGIEHYFWRGRQNKLVKLIKRVKKTHHHSNSTTILLNLTIRCKQLYDELHLGTGNLVLGYYAMRLAAATAQVDYTFQCIQTPEAALKARTQGSILSWLQGYYAAPRNPTTFSPYDPPLPTLNEAARGMGRIPLYYMSEAIRHDLRNMALQVVGPSRQNETLTTDPLYSNVDIDDVAIHFRCGDIMKGFNSDAYGIVAFDSYRRYISPLSKTIGIVTASFQESALRSRDRGTTRACQVLVHALVEYLHHVFPNTTISMRNEGPNETLAMAFARLVMANQTLISPSTFSIFPAIASFGTSYVQRANLTYFVAPIVQHYMDVQYMDGPLLSAIDVFYFHSHVSNETRRITLMLDWLMQPTCRVHHLNAKNATAVLVCGGEANGTTVTRATDMIRLVT